MLHRSFRFKLAPTAGQLCKLREFSGVCRLLYNLALEQRRDWWRQYKSNSGSVLSYVSQSRELTALRAEFDWIAAVPTGCQQQALRDLDRAFTSFFSGRAGYPTPRKKGVNDAFRFLGRDINVRKLNAKWSAVRLPKIGWVKFRETRPLRGSRKSVQITRDALGWHVSFICGFEHEVPAAISCSVGIDRGVSNTLTLSSGEQMSLPASLQAIDWRYRSAQRTVARRKKGSNRRLVALRRAARLAAKRARIRRDWQHKTSLSIASRFGTVILEGLDIRGMTASTAGTVDSPGRGVRQKAGLNRSILNQGWYAFERILAYKLEERGGTLIKVNPAYTSQTCSECGAVDARSRKNQASFVCVECGFAIHADHNAAINILRRNTACMRMEEELKLPGEVRTRSRLTSAENLPT